MRILVTFALEQEFAPWRRLRRFERIKFSGVPVYSAPIAGAEVRVGLTGIGQMQAVRVARLLLADRPDACISAGLAGGLRPEHPSGRVLAARTLRMAEEKFVVNSDTALRRLAAVSGARVVDSFYSAERIILTAREKAALGLLADAVEMESFAILSEAARSRVPGVAIRAVSDSAREDLPVDFNRALGRQGRLSFPRLLGQIARRPQRLKGLIRLGVESRAAAAQLARFLDGYVEALALQHTAKETGPRAVPA